MSGSERLLPRESPAVHVRLGRMEYGRALAIQRRLHERRARGEIDDVLLTVEHDPVFTRGRNARETEFLVPPEVVQRRGIPVVDVERGGDVTYHGPGQIVAYPIVDLRDRGRNVEQYVRALEQAVIATLGSYGIAGSRRSGCPGVWVHEGKVASVGVYVKRWVTRHGLALNVDVDATHFAMIHPCGLPVRAVSMNDLLDEPTSVEHVESRLVEAVAALLGWRLRAGALVDVGEGDDG